MSKQQKPKKSSAPPKSFLKKGENFRQIYITGAIGSFTPFDYRLLLYTHKAEVPDTTKDIAGLPLTQVIQAEIVMPISLAKKLRDLIDRQINEREKQIEKTEEKEK